MHRLAYYGDVVALVHRQLSGLGALSKSIKTIKFTKNLIAITTHLLLLDDKVYWNDRFTFLFPQPQTIFPTIPTTKFLHLICSFANSRKSLVSYSKTFKPYHRWPFLSAWR